VRASVPCTKPRSVPVIAEAQPPPIPTEPFHHRRRPALVVHRLRGRAGGNISQTVCRRDRALSGRCTSRGHFKTADRMAGKGPRPCEKTIAAYRWAIYCRRGFLRHGEDFGHTIIRAIGLLIFVRVKTFHTGAPGDRQGVGGASPLR